VEFKKKLGSESIELLNIYNPFKEFCIKVKPRNGTVARGLIEMISRGKTNDAGEKGNNYRKRKKESQVLVAYSCNLNYSSVCNSKPARAKTSQDPI
jgi:hypothetical protein